MCLFAPAEGYLNCPENAGVAALPSASKVTAAVELETIFDAAVNVIEFADWLLIMYVAFGLLTPHGPSNFSVYGPPPALLPS